jgi:hypothetical protein
MRARLRAIMHVVAFLLGVPAISAAAHAEPARVTRDGGVVVAGRQVHCDNVRTRLDRHLPNLGAAAPDDRLLMLNPRLLSAYGKTVQLFVFHHECGHHHVGESELEADCWAVSRGVRDGWLDRTGLGEVCESFEDAPETSTHPSGRRRCANLNRCFASAGRQVARAGKAAVGRDLTQVSSAPPRLVAGPRLLWSGGRSGGAPQ